MTGFLLFKCDRSKCGLASSTSRAAGLQLAQALGYEHKARLQALGIVIHFEDRGDPLLASFCLPEARRKLRLIRGVAQCLRHRRLHTQSLVMPLFTWAGAFAVISESEAYSLRQEALFFGKEHLVETPPCVLLEVLGWRCDPVFMRHWSVLSEVARLHGRLRAWQETAPLAVALRPWHRVLSVARSVLAELQWWTDDGSQVCRVDASGQVRTYRLNEDGLAVLFQWLADWHRRLVLQRCGRVARSLHRSGEHLARGLDLPGVPPGALTLFRGHCKHYEEFSRPSRYAALVTGCSTWWLQGKLRLEAPLTCRCGLAEPSRPHLLWVCEAFRHLAPPGVPLNRVEERLLAKVVPEMPAPPVVLAVDEFLDSLAEEVLKLPAAPEGFLLATDGSCVTEVSAVAFAFLGGDTCGLGVPGEDQTPFKAEVQALLWLLEVLLRAGRPGDYFVLVDCTAALFAARGKGHLRKLCDRFTVLWNLLETAGVKVTLHWIPSHGKRAPDGWRPPGSFSEAQARLLNQAADAEARRLAARRARGSARQLCCQARTEAETWETGAINALHRISSAFELEYQA